MWFKQLNFYPINLETLPDLDTLTAKLSEAEFAPITGLDWFSEGFAAPHGFSPELVFPADFTWSIALKKADVLNCRLFFLLYFYFKIRKI